MVILMLEWVHRPGDYPQVHAFTKRVRSKGVHLALERGR